MILFLLLLIQAGAHDNTPEEISSCALQSDQPERFCLADRKHERAESDLTAALARARVAAVAQREEIRRFSRTIGGVTLDGDPVRALEAAQRAWERSYQADCLVRGLEVATGSAGTEGVTTSEECEADRILDRVRFMNEAYTIER